MDKDTLKPQTTLREYVVKRVLGRGSFGVTYLAEKINEHYAVAIKEYLPADLVIRDADGSTVNVSRSSPGDRDEFQTGLDKFLEESRTLSGLRSPYIVQVVDTFELNGTAYMVMKYEEGGTLDRYLAAHQEPLAEDRLLAVFTPLLEGLRTIHAKWLLHRDIKPDNIYIRRDGSPLLIDFGTARHALSAKHGGMTEYLTPGFAPPEQYDRNADHGPWTDIYAVGATMYYCVTRIRPYEGRFRTAERDPVVPATRAAPAMYDPELLEVVDWMMRPDYRDRPQSVEDVLLRLQELKDPARDGGRGPSGEKTRVAADATVERPVPKPDAAGAPDRPAAPGTEKRERQKNGSGAAPDPGTTLRLEPTRAAPGGAFRKLPLPMVAAVAAVLVVVVSAYLFLSRPGAAVAPDRAPAPPAPTAEQEGAAQGPALASNGTSAPASGTDASADAATPDAATAPEPSIPAKKAQEPVPSAAAPAPADEQSEPAASTQSLEIALWDAVKDSDDAPELQAYVDKYPEGTFAGLARARLAKLEAAARKNALEVSIDGPEVVPLKKKTYFTIHSRNAVKARWSIAGFTNGWVPVDPMVDGHQIYVEPTDRSRAGDSFTLVFVVLDESGQSREIRKKFRIGR